MDANEKGRFDRMEEHIIQLQKSVEQVLNAITGNSLNGNRGIVRDISDLKQDQADFNSRLKTIEDQENKSSGYVDMLKLGIKTLVIALIGAIVALVLKR